MLASNYWFAFSVLFANDAVLASNGPSSLGKVVFSVAAMPTTGVPADGAYVDFTTGSTGKTTEFAALELNDEYGVKYFDGATSGISPKIGKGP